MMGTTLAVILKLPSPSTIILLVSLTLVMDTVSADADCHLVLSASWRNMGSPLKERARWSAESSHVAVFLAPTKSWCLSKKTAMD